MNAVGIDVSKGKSTVTILRPYGEIVAAPFEIKHTRDDINSLIDLINSTDGESRVVMEYTGRYHEALVHHLSNSGSSPILEAMSTSQVLHAAMVTRSGLTLLIPTGT